MTNAFFQASFVWMGDAAAFVLSSPRASATACSWAGCERQTTWWPLVFVPWLVILSRVECSEGVRHLSSADFYAPPLSSSGELPTTLFKRLASA